MSIACENSVMKLDCEQKNGIIRISLANYGRFSLTTCNSFGATNEWNVSCRLPESKRIVAERLVLLLKGQKLNFSMSNVNHQDLSDKSNNDLCINDIFCFLWLDKSYNDLPNNDIFCFLWLTFFLILRFYINT